MSTGTADGESSPRIEVTETAADEALSLLDGEGLEILTGSYTPYGNDGLHFNAAIIDAPARSMIRAREQKKTPRT